MLFRRVPATTALVLAALAGFAGATDAWGQSHPLPASLVPFTAPEGQALFLDADARSAYWPLSTHFVTQATQTYCGVASSVMVLNALGVAAPTSTEYDPYRYFTQGNYFTERTEAIRPRAAVAEAGMTLNQLAANLETHGAATKVVHASDTQVDAFRREAAGALARSGHYVIVNFNGTVLGQENGGHFSPLAAFDAETDRFLVLDVSRYMHGPYWVGTAALFSAMNTVDSDNAGRTRGFVVVSAK